MRAVMISDSAAALLRRPGIAMLSILLASAWVFGIWVWSADTPTTSFNGDPHSRLSGILYGTAHKPYVQRVLVGSVTVALYDALPRAACDSLRAGLLRLPAVQRATSRLGWETGFLPQYLIALALAFAALVGFAFTIRRLWQSLYLADAAVANGVPLIALLALVPIFPTGPHYIYDFPALFFFTCGLALVIERRWLLFYPVFAIGCLNKETIILLALVFIVLHGRRLPRRTALAHLAVQGAIFLAVKLLVMSTFAANPGVSLEYHLNTNLGTLLSGFSLVGLVVGAGLVWLVLHDWRRKHPALRGASIIALPFAALLVWGGIITELRDLYELVPILLLLALHTIFFSLRGIPYRLEGTATELPP